MTQKKTNHAEALLEAKRRKKKKSSGASLSWTTGDPAYDMKQFNKHMSSDFDDEDEAEAKANKAAAAAAKALGTVPAASPDGSISVPTGGESSGESGGEGGGESGGVSESLQLTEAKRYVRRYYIKPQNVFCSNKTDIINALIEFEDQDCTIYTLINLGDVKDVTKLTTDDVIYYYEDHILYDKNMVRIMDYDLYIKHEEERKRINPDKVSDAVFNDVYEDRLTGGDVDEAFNQEYPDIDAYGRKLYEGKEIDGACDICGEPIQGYGNNAEPYLEGGRCCDSCNIKFVIPARLAQLDRKEENSDEA